MQLYVAITDQDWFDFLKAQAPDEVNFWRPSGRAFRTLQPGELFLFKPHRLNYIMGGGFFSYFTALPASFVWRTFDTKNGAPDETAMRASIERYRNVEPERDDDYQVGCILLQRPFFLSPSDWIPLPEWKKGLMQGLTYDIEQQPGRMLWERAIEAASAQPVVRDLLPCDAPLSPRFGQPQLIMPRLGQGSFRVIVTDCYQRRCAITNSPVLCTLDAVHIRPYAKEGPHAPENGLLLRQDLHTLFDRGYLTVSPEYRLEVSRRIREEFENGREYYALHGNQIRLPQETDRRPATDYLSWHNENVFRG
jgi:putative restriction endonuclease